MGTYYFTGNLTTGSNVVTNLNTMLNLQVGQLVASPGLPSGSVYITQLGQYQMTLSAAVLSTAIGEQLIATDVLGVNLTNLQATLQQVILLMALITMFPKPSYSVDGQSVSWDTYYNTLLGSIKELRAQIQIEQGPFEYQTQIWTGTNYGGW